MPDYDRPQNPDFATGRYRVRPVKRKLTYEQREQIKRLYSEGTSARELAGQFGVSAGYIYEIADKRK